MAFNIQPLTYFWLSCETLNTDEVLFLHSTPIPLPLALVTIAYVRIMTTDHTPTPVSLGGGGEVELQWPANSTQTSPPCTV
jgi:hypothetical protein